MNGQNKKLITKEMIAKYNKKIQKTSGCLIVFLILISVGMIELTVASFFFQIFLSLFLLPLSILFVVLCEKMIKRSREISNVSRLYLQIVTMCEVQSLIEYGDADASDTYVKLVKFTNGERLRFTHYDIGYKKFCENNTGDQYCLVREDPVHAPLMIFNLKEWEISEELKSCVRYE